MFSLRRIMAVAGVLVLAVIITSSHVWGESDQELKDFKAGNKAKAPETVDSRLFREWNYSRFADTPLIVYKNTKDEILFGDQLTVALGDVPVRPRDYLVMVDTSASKAGGYLAAAQKLVEMLILKMGADDRAALWTANVEAHDLSRGFKSNRQLNDAQQALGKEYPSGAVNLKKGLATAIASFEGGVSRQRVLLYLGDGNSSAGPLDSDSRAALSDDMVKREIAFFAFPLGPKPEPVNLHGFITATGGKVIRVMLEDKPEDAIGRLLTAAAVPILYPQSFQSPVEVTEVFPTKLPPLRGDVPTLLAGKLRKPIEKLEFTVTGTVGGKEVRVVTSLPVPKAEVENFFLSSVLNQWREHKDRPALLQADRTLAYAYDENQMSRSDLLAQADWALEQDKLDHAYQLYRRALGVDPHNAEAKAGMDVVQQMRDGKLTREQLNEIMKPKAGERMVRIRSKNKGGDGTVSREDAMLGHNALEKQPDRPPEVNVPPVQQDILKEANARRAVADQQQSNDVLDIIRRANRLVLTDPDAAHELLKQTLEGVRSNPDLSPKKQIALTEQLASKLQEIDRLGVRVKREQSDARNLAIQADAKRTLEKINTAAQNQIIERMRTFDTLMREGREDMAFIYAKQLRQELVDRGETVPTALVAAYDIAQPAKHLRVLRQLQRERDELWLDTYLEVERSHMPIPDEPPIRFPTPAQIKKLTRRADGSSQFDNWTDWSNYRIAKYSSSSLGEEMPKRGLELQKKLSMPIKSFKPDENWTLQDALDYLADRYDLTFDIYERAIQDELKGVNVKNIEIAKDKWELKDVTLGTVLRKLLAKIPLAPSEATYIIRRDAIEITTSKMAAYEKVVRVYPVADLLLFLNGTGGAAQGGIQIGGIQVGGIQVGGIQVGGLGALGGGLGALGGGLGALGGGLGALGGGLGALGGGLGALGGGLGALGGGLGALGAGGLGALGGGLGALGAGGLGALGGGLGALGAGGLGALGAGGLGALGAGGLGALGAGGLGALGAGGLGALGGGINIGGVQIGGIGQLGGQQAGGQLFGSSAIQGQILIGLIKQIVGEPGEWENRVRPGQLVRGPDGILLQVGQIIPPVNADGTTRILLPGEELNNIVFFAPAQAIIVKGTSRITPRYRPPYPVVPGQIGAGLGNLGGEARGPDPLPRDGHLAIVPKNDANRVGDKRGDAMAKKDAPLDPKAIWQDALARGVDNPSLIIAVADFLGQMERWDHVAEFLKANLRQGIVVKPWVYETLALALKNSGGAAEEIERAEVSIVELQPADADGFMKAARAMADLKRYDRALAFAKQASILEPNTPYAFAEALTYAEATDDLDAIQWASVNLLKRDWPVRNQEIQRKATQQLNAAASKLAKSRPEDSKKLLDAVQAQRRRDLVIKLTWQGEADLDLKVIEPTGSKCWALNRLTVGGGTLVGDTLADMNNETYVAAEAYSGEYQIAIDRVWGRPQFDKAQLRIIRHQGTAEETEELISVDLTDKKPLKPIVLKNGRRTEAAYVPPPSAQKSSDAALAPLPTRHDQVLGQLRDLADPENVTEVKGIRGSFGSPGASAVPEKQTVRTAPAPSPNDRVLYQTKVSSFVANSLEVTAQAVMSADRRSVRLSVQPMYTPLSSDANPKVVSSVIP